MSMSNAPTEIEVRAITSPEDAQRFFTLAAQAFGPTDAIATTAADWQRFIAASPEFDPSQLRGAFRDGALVAGCTYVERWMTLHGARVRVGCVGAVVTDSAFRKQGAARVLMEDVNALSAANGCSFSLLHGFEFYLRWGYADVFDNSVIVIDRASALRLGPSAYAVRPATEEDASGWLDFFTRHYAAQPGGFERSAALQAHMLGFMRSLTPEVSRLSQHPPVVAVDADGAVRGYLQFTFAPLDAFGIEPAADDWPAALALLQHHARLCESLPHPPDKLFWRVKPGSPLADLVADHIAVCIETDASPNLGWMARLSNATTAIQALLPAWQVRWANASRPWQGVLALHIGAEAFAFEFTEHSVTATAGSADTHVHLTPQVFTQLAFGHRSARWAAGQTDQHIPAGLLPLLDVMFPRASIWLAASDGF
jgi:GNAT superfamily N-acetyltransferase